MIANSQDERQVEPLESAYLTHADALALLRLVESAPDVRRRYQFYTWLQSQVQPLLPHSVALCGAYSRQRRHLVFEVFNSVVLPPTLLMQLGSADSALLRHLSSAWIDGAGRPLRLEMDAATCSAIGAEALALRDTGIARMLVHGVSRPERLHEIASLFVFGGPTMPRDEDLERRVDLVVHSLHATYERAMSVERDVGVTPPRTPLPSLAPQPRSTRVTPREAQILSWVREGKNNQEIGIELGISALTVKNHIQKILRKLGASNRAHAVALAMQGRLLSGDGPD